MRIHATAIAARLRRISTENGLAGQILRGGAGSIVIKGANAGLAFTLAVVLARILGPDGYGLYSFVLAIIMLTAIPAQVGIPQLVVRETARAHANHNWGQMRGLWRWSNATVFAFSGIVLVVIAVVALFYTETLEDVRASAMVLGLPLVPLIALANVRAACLRGLYMVVWGQLPEKVFRPTLLLILVGFWLILLGKNQGPTVEDVIGLHILAAFITLLLGGLMLWQVRPEGVKRRPVPQYSSSVWFRAAIPLALTAGMYLVINYVDLLIIGLFHTDEEVGVYRVVFQMALLVIFGLQAMNQALQPHFSRLYSQSQISRLEYLSITSARVILLISLPPVIIFIGFGENILGWIFGDEFRAGGLALSLLAAGQLINASMGSVAMLLNMTGHELDTTRSVAFAALANVLLNILLVPLYGMEGAAASSALTVTLWNLLLRKKVQKRLGFDPMAFSRLRPLSHEVK